MLTYIRKKLGLTQEATAEILGVRQTAVQMIEKRQSIPYWHQVAIRRWAKAHGHAWDDRWFFEQVD